MGSEAKADVVGVVDEITGLETVVFGFEQIG